MSTSYKVISTSHAPSAIGPYSQAITSNGFTFISGCIPLNPETMKVVEGGVEEQVKQVLANLFAVVKEAGADLSQVVKTTIFLQNMGDFGKVNPIYAEFFNPYKPARSTVAVAGLPLGVLVEIEAVVAHSV